MKRFQTRKRAKEIYRYIEKESSYRPAKFIKDSVIAQIAASLSINGEMSQSYIDAFVKVFQAAKRQSEADRQSADHPKMAS